VLTVGDVVGVKEGGNPHRWYNPGDVRAMIDQISAAYKKIDPADAAFFDEIEEEATQVGRHIRKACLEMPDPAPLSMFDNVYAEPTALLREEREQYAAYLDSFVPEEAAQ